MTETWPDSLPLPLFDGYGIQPLDAALRTDMEQGPARQRQRFTAIPERVAVKWRFSQWEYALFRAWYRDKAKRGAAWFEITLLSGLGMVTHQARFVGSDNKPYDAQSKRGDPTGAKWIVSATLEVRDSPDLSADALDIALSEDMDGLFAALADFHDFVHVVAPGAGGWA